jgi:hypothetical protein
MAAKGSRTSSASLMRLSQNIPTSTTTGRFLFYPKRRSRCATAPNNLVANVIDRNSTVRRSGDRRNSRSHAAPLMRWRITAAAAAAACPLLRGPPQDRSNCITVTNWHPVAPRPHKKRLGPLSCAMCRGHESENFWGGHQLRMRLEVQVSKPPVDIKLEKPHDDVASQV